MASIKLYYFNSAGRGECLRLLLAASGKDWEDVRFTGEDWPNKYKAEAPFGQAPFLEYKGKKYGQSVAIATFLAREFGFGGKTNLESLRIDEVVQLCQDLIACMVKMYYEKDEAKKAEILEKLKNEDAPKFFGFFEKLLEESGTGYFVGKQLTLADFAVYDVVVNAIQGPMLKLTGADEKFPLIRAVCHKVADHPKVKEYLAKQKAS